MQNIKNIDFDLLLDAYDEILNVRDTFAKFCSDPYPEFLHQPLTDIQNFMIDNVNEVHLYKDAHRTDDDYEAFNHYADGDRNRYYLLKQVCKPLVTKEWVEGYFDFHFDMPNPYEKYSFLECIQIINTHLRLTWKHFDSLYKD